MNRLLSYWFAGLAFLLLLNGCKSFGIFSNPQTPPTPTASTHAVDNPAIDHFADTWNNIHLFLTFDYNISDPTAVAKYYDFVWGASVKDAAAFRLGNPDIFLTYYISFLRDNGTFFNSSAFHNLTYWKTVHPDWILYKCDRVTPADEYGDPQVPLDFANPALIAWQIQTYAQPASENGYDGIAADNVNLQNAFGACGVYIHGQWVQRYSGQPNDPQWSANIITWLTRMQLALHSLHHPLALIPNLSIGNLSLTDQLTQQFVSHIDGVLDEEGFTLYGDGYLTGNAWVQKIQIMENVQKQHKSYYMINQFPSVGRAEIQWALASYLMGKEHSTALFISASQQYGSDLWYHEYDSRIGSPSGPMYQMQNVYMRVYSHGLSIVNPSATESYTVSLNTKSQFSDLYGSAVGQTITMPPHSGMVLLQ